MVRVLRWAGIAVAGIVALVVVLMLGLNTQPGRRFIADRLAGFSTASGLNFRAGRIDGSIYGRMHLRDVEIRDAGGVFARVPEMTLDWRPFAYLHSKIDVRELSAPTAELIRNPQFKPTPTDPNAPLLPDIDLTLGRLDIGRMTIQPAVTGRRHITTLKGSARIAEGRAQIKLDAGALRGVGVAGGDTLHLMLDAVPDANRFGLQARLSAPQGGLVDSYAGLGKALTVSVGGQGDWANWRGRIQANAAGAPLAVIDVTGRNGTFDTRGQVRPGLLLSGAAVRLVEPAIQFHLVTALDKRKADVRLEASSRAFATKVAGLIDLGANRFGNLQIEAKLLEAGAIAPNVEAKAAQITAHFDGAFGSPDVRYRMTAQAIGFGGVRILGLEVGGEGRLDTAHLKIPVHASARAVTGVNAAAGGLLTRLRVDGDIAYQDGGGRGKLGSH